MSARFAHFAINAADTERALAFYAAVFGWTLSPWGPPGFFKVDDDPSPPPAGAPAAVIGALQQRRDLLDGQPTNGLECTFSVDDVDEVVAQVVAHGGRILMEKATIPGVGDLVFFADPEGNVVGAMRYEAG